MAENRRSVPSSAVAVTVTAALWGWSVLEPADGQRLATGQAQRSIAARDELEREDTHPDQVERWTT